jgi:hypothetical protein
MEGLKFTLQRKEMPIELTTVEGVVKKYKLREFSGTEREQYLDKFKMDIAFEEGKAVIQSAKDFKPLSESEFLALCLYDEKNELVSKEEISKFPATTIVGLYKAAQELSGLEAEAVKKAKND